MINKIGYINKVPKRKDCIKWNFCEDEKVILEFENKGFMKWMTQKVLKKPKKSYIHLDKIGSFVWCMIDGERTIETIGKNAEKEFGEEIKPLYKRLLKYFEIMASYGFIEFDKK